MKLSTQTLTAASARHPWRTIAAWIATFAIAIAAIVALLGDSLTTEGAPTNNPESERAIDTIARAFPPDPERFATDVVVIRSAQYTVEEPEFRGFVGQTAQRERRAGARRGPLVPDGAEHGRCLGRPSRDARLDRDPRRRRHRRSDRGARGGERGRGVRGLDRRRPCARPRLQSPLAGGPREGRAPVRASRGSDHPAARLRRRRGRADPAAHGDHLDRRRARAHCHPRAAVRALDLRREHAHGDGPRARDRLLALRRLAVSRGAREGPREVGCDRSVRRHGQSRRRLQRDGLRRRDVRDAPRAELDHALARRRARSSSASCPSPRRRRCCPRSSACSETA